MEIKGTPQMNKTLRNTLITAAAIATCAFGSKAEASTVHHLHEGLTSYRNDGISEIITTDGQNIVCMTEAHTAAWPLPGGKGEEGAAMMDSSTRGTVSSVLYNKTPISRVSHGEDNVARYGYTLGQAHSAYVAGCF